MVIIVVISYNCTPFLHSLLSKGKAWVVFNADLLSDRQAISLNPF